MVPDEQHMGDFNCSKKDLAGIGAKDPSNHLIIFKGGKDGYLVKAVEVLN